MPECPTLVEQKQHSNSEGNSDSDFSFFSGWSSTGVSNAICRLNSWTSYKWIESFISANRAGSEQNGWKA